MRFTEKDFLNWKNKSITLLGMSGVGKTTLASFLPKDSWFHYSGDYRIGTKYLTEHILDEIKAVAMQTPYLAQLLRRDLIHIGCNITMRNLDLLSDFLGKAGSVKDGGMDLPDFLYRQKLYRNAEILAMRDVPVFMERARKVYGYVNFINDAGGSVCNFGSEDFWSILSKHTLVLYIEADDTMEKTLIQRTRLSPKPLLYEESFFKESLKSYMRHYQIDEATSVNPDDFVVWVFPKLIAWRKPLYEELARSYGYVVNSKDINSVRDEKDFFSLVCSALSKGDLSCH